MIDNSTGGWDRKCMGQAQLNMHVNYKFAKRMTRFSRKNARKGNLPIPWVLCRIQEKWYEILKLKDMQRETT